MSGLPDGLLPRVPNDGCFFAERGKPSLKVGRQRGRLIQGAGIDPQSRAVEVPGALERPVQEPGP